MSAASKTPVLCHLEQVSQKSGHPVGQHRFCKRAHALGPPETLLECRCGPAGLVSIRQASRRCQCCQCGDHTWSGEVQEVRERGRTNPFSCKGREGQPGRTRRDALGAAPQPPPAALGSRRPRGPLRGCWEHISVPVSLKKCLCEWGDCPSSRALPAPCSGGGGLVRLGRCWD